MILVDTSIWINHLRNHDSQLANLLQQGLVVCHPLIVGELACGNLHNRQKILTLLNSLEMLQETTNVLDFIENNKLMGKGIGIVDVSILAAAYFSNALLWTADKRLHNISVELQIAAKIPPLN
jgi:predicted nucleic acid-binding protein